LENLDLLAFPESQVPKEIQGHKVPKVAQDFKGPEEILERPANLEYLVKLGPLAKTDQMVKKEVLVLLACLVHLDLQGLEVNKD